MSSFVTPGSSTVDVVRRRPTLIYYEFADVLYSSFYTTGFALNAPLYGYRFLRSRRPPGLLRASGTLDEWRIGMSVPSRLVFRFLSDRDDYYFCIDTADHDLNYHVPLLREARIYFKVNYTPDCVALDPVLSAFAHKIRPIRPFFPLRSGDRLPLVPRLLPCASMAWDLRSALRAVRDTVRVPRLETLKKLRGTRESLDVFFVTSYYPGSNHAPAMEFRYRLMQELDGQGLHDSSVYGFASREEIPQPFGRYSMPWFSLSEYLRTVARSRLAVYVRGLWHCVSFKFGEYLALGMPVVGQSLANNVEGLANLPHFDEQFAFDEPREIALQAGALLRQSERRTALAESNARVFDTVLSPETVTADALDVLGLRRRC